MIIMEKLPINKASEYVTRGCGSTCEGCRIRDDKDTAFEREITADEWIEVNKKIAQLGVEQLTLLGGEPTDKPDFNRIVRSVIDDTSMDFLIFTKGVFERRFQEFIEATDSDRGVIIASVDTTDPKSSDFTQLKKSASGIKFINQLLEAREKGETEVNPGANIVLSKANSDHFSDSVEHFLDKGVFVNFSPFIHGEGADWIRRGPFVPGLSLTQDDLPQIQSITQELLELKEKHKKLLIPSVSYIEGLDPHAVTQDIQCVNANKGLPPVLRIWPDRGPNGETGVLHECLDLAEMTKMDKPLTVDDLFTEEGRNRFSQEFRDRVKNCIGCYWSNVSPI
jgi:molybdenum cofactor biosynthesis enzyme MoaA